MPNYVLNLIFVFLLENGIQLHYNKEKIWCDWPEAVECGDRPVCDINDENCDEVKTPTNAPKGTCESLGHCSSKDEGDLKPLGPCESCFCQCSHQSYTQFCCPSGLVYNPDLGMCDWEWDTPGCQ